MPRDAEFARVRQYMTRRCRYAAALIMNVQASRHCAASAADANRSRPLLLWSLHQPPAAAVRCRRSLPGMLCAVPALGRDPQWHHAPPDPMLTVLHVMRAVVHAVPAVRAVQMPEHGRDPDEIMHLLEDWTDMQLEGFFK